MTRLPFLFASFFLLSLTCQAQNGNNEALNSDSIRVSLLTCGPGDELYSLFGHTALRVTTIADGRDIVFNYGVFSFEQPNFFLRFVAGLTDYEVGACYFHDFIEEYASEQRYVKEQELQLTQDEKQTLLKNLYTNCLPQYATYRYNYFYQNCTTMARDIVLRSLNRKLYFSDNQIDEQTYRSCVNSYVSHLPWQQFGIDLLLGYKADKPISKAEMQFLPEQLCKDFNSAYITGSGNSHSAVAATHLLIPDTRPTPSVFPFVLRPWFLVAVLCLIVMGITLAELKNNRICRLCDIILFLLTGLPGIVLLLMVFSQHPTVSANLQILLLNPLNLLFVVSVAKSEKQHRFPAYIFFYALCLILFLGGNVFQQYAEGLNLLATTLLLRYALLFIRFR